MEKEKKPIYKKWWFWLIIVLVISAIVISLILIKKGNNGVGSAGISLEEFNQIELGMSQSKVQSIIDSEDKWDNDDIYDKCCQEISKSKEESIYKYTYKYLGENGGYAEITYKADYSNGDIFVLPTVSDKQQFNLK